MYEPLDELEVLTDKLVARASYSEKNRFSLLAVHSLLSMYVGLSIFNYGGPDNFKTIVGIPVWFPYALWLLPLLGGVFLGLGLIKNRDVWFEAFGMTMILVWDLLMATGFMIAWIQGTLASIYPIGIYVGLSTFMCIHLSTLRKFI